MIEDEQAWIQTLFQKEEELLFPTGDYVKTGIGGDFWDTELERVSPKWDSYPNR